MKGFFQAATAILLFSLLITLAALSVRDQDRTSDATFLIASGAVSAAWSDLSADAFRAANLSILREGRNVTLTDRIPALMNVSHSLESYGRFASTRMNSSGLTYAFAPDPTAMGSFVTLDGLYVNYAYPDWQKSRLILNSTSAGYAHVSNLTLRIRSTSLAFARSYSNGSCNPPSGWTDYVACGPATPHCLYLDLVVTDATGAVYDNACDTLDLDAASLLQMDFTDGTTRTMSLAVGPLPTVFDLQPSGAELGLEVGTTLHPATANYSVFLPGTLSVRRTAFGIERQGRLQP